jgi:hypothetical protein
MKRKRAPSALMDKPKPQAAASRQVLPLLAVYCGLIVMASLLGGWMPNCVRLTHTRMQTLISGVGGLMLGIAVFHLLPHSLEYTASPTMTSPMVDGRVCW